ncbi:hypothetical protein [Glutamicibacter sp. AOP33-2CA-4]|uniref:hypothetical protein n=1 Tax=Glutamicibacter sp. AOP33-2CA-4 TaxID=3457690 RepID=UPI004033F44A
MILAFRRPHGRVYLFIHGWIRRIIMTMSGAMNYIRKDLESTVQIFLDKHGGSMAPRDFLRVVSDVSDSISEPLTEGERNFLLENTDLSEVDLSPEGRLKSDLIVLDAQAKSLDLVEKSAYTTAEVARIVGRDEANVRRAKAKGDYFALARSEGKQSLFPKWQFTSEGVVPGLRELIPAFPRFYHPLAIETVMTQSNEDYLGGRSPADWLITGGALEAVLELVSHLEFE